MLWDKIINPETGKTVTIRSNKGMEILRNYVDVMKGGAAKTPSKNQAPPKNKLTPPDKKLKPKPPSKGKPKPPSKGRPKPPSKGGPKPPSKGRPKPPSKGKPAPPKSKKASDMGSTPTSPDIEKVKERVKQRNIDKQINTDKQDWDDFFTTSCLPKGQSVTDPACLMKMKKACQSPNYWSNTTGENVPGEFERCVEAGAHCSKWRNPKKDPENFSSACQCVRSSPDKCPSGVVNNTNNQQSTEIIGIKGLCEYPEPIDEMFGDESLKKIHDKLQSIRNSFENMGRPTKKIGEVTHERILFGYYSLYMGIMTRSFNFLWGGKQISNSLVRTGAPRLSEGDIVWVNRNLISNVNSGDGCTDDELDDESAQFDCESMYNGKVQRWWKGKVCSPEGKQIIMDDDGNEITNTSIDTVVWQENPGLNNWRVTIEFDNNPKINGENINISKKVTYSINVNTGALIRTKPMENKLKNFFRKCDETYNASGKKYLSKPDIEEQYTLAITKEAYQKNSEQLALGIFNFGGRVLSKGGELAKKTAEIVIKHSYELMKKGFTEGLPAVKKFLANSIHLCTIMARKGFSMGKEGVLRALDMAHRAKVEITERKRWNEFLQTWNKIASSDTSQRCNSFLECCKPFVGIFMYELGEMQRGVHNLAYIDCKKNLGRWRSLTQEDNDCAIELSDFDKRLSEGSQKLQDWYSGYRETEEGKILAPYYNERSIGIISGVCSRQKLKEFTRELVRVRCPSVTIQGGRVTKVGESFRARSCSNWIEYAKDPSYSLILSTLYNYVIFLKTCLKWYGSQVSELFDDPYVVHLRTALGFPRGMPYHQCVSGDVRTFSSCLDYFEKLLTEIYIKRNHEDMTTLIDNYKNRTSGDNKWIMSGNNWSELLEEDKQRRHSNDSYLESVNGRIGDIVRHLRSNKTDNTGEDILLDQLLRYIRWSEDGDECRYDDGTNGVEGGSCPDEDGDSAQLSLDIQRQLINIQEDEDEAVKVDTQGGGSIIRKIKVGLSIRKVENMIKNGVLVDNIY